MGPLEFLATVAIVMGVLVTAPRFLGVDPIGVVARWLWPGDAAPTTTSSDFETAGMLAAPLDEIDRGLKDLGEHIEAVRHLAEERGTELERFREGYNFSVMRSLARGVIKAIDMIADFQSQLEFAHAHADGESKVLKDALTRFEATASQLEMLLEANQVEVFWPEVGESIESDSGRFEPVEVRETSEHDDHGRVAEVLYPGWVLVRGDGDERVIREARISVFGPAKGEVVE